MLRRRARFDGRAAHSAIHRSSPFASRRLASPRLASPRVASSNNTVFADSSGTIAYFHANFVPRRDPAFD
jgi:hypothetical protein